MSGMNAASETLDIKAGEQVPWREINKIKREQSVHTAKLAVLEEAHKHLASQTATLAATINKLAWTVVGAVIMAVMTLILRDGLIGS